MATKKKNSYDIEWVHWSDPFTGEMDVAYLLSIPTKETENNAQLAYIPPNGPRDRNGYLTFISIAGYINTKTPYYMNVEEHDMHLLTDITSLRKIADKIKKIPKLLAEHKKNFKKSNV